MILSRLYERLLNSIRKIELRFFQNSIIKLLVVWCCSTRLKRRNFFN